MMKLGELLIAAGLIKETHLQFALHRQEQTGGPLGTILLSLQLLTPLQLYEFIASQQSLPYISLTEQPANVELSEARELDYFLRYLCIPWRLENGFMVLACSGVTPKLQHWAKQYYHDQVRFVISPPRDILAALHRAFGDELDEQARNRLRREQPDYSAFETLQPRQRDWLFATMLIIGCGIYFAPYYTLAILIGLLNLFYIATISMKWFLLPRPPMEPDSVGDNVTGIYPVYTILVPMYKEARSASRIIDAINQLDYPVARLDVKLVIEADDEETFNAIKEARPAPHMEIIRVPYSQPRTKPKACNYALQFALGDIVTIYDAEDRPDPAQLKQAAAHFQHSNDNVVCLQARLNYYNRNENLLTQWFALEYGILFNRMLPGLQHRAIPIPLGGTSNHINLKRLRELGEWDPYNVTEDANLGLRLWIAGYRTEMLDSITLEEAPIHLSGWVRQRSRWIKGYMQTWLVYMREPRRLYRQLGATGFWGMQCFIGGPCLVFLTAPILWLVSIGWISGLLELNALPDWLLSICFLSLLLGFICHWHLGLLITRERKWQHMGLAILSFPFYWLLHSLASLRALWQLIVNPHFWEKTSHGLSQTSRNPS